MTIEKFIETAKKHKSNIHALPGKVDKWVQTILSSLNYCLCGHQLESCESPRAYRLYKDTLEMFLPLLNCVSAGQTEDRESEAVLRCISYLIKCVLSLKIYKLRKAELNGLQKQIEAFEKRKSAFQKSYTIINQNQVPIELNSSSSGYFSSEASISSNMDDVHKNPHVSSSQEMIGSSQAATKSVMTIPTEVYNIMIKTNYINHFLAQSNDWWEKFNVSCKKLQQTSLASSKPNDDSNSTRATVTAHLILSQVVLENVTMNQLFRVSVSILNLI